MRIWVDADAVPRAIKDILFRFADARRVEGNAELLVVVALPPGPDAQLAPTAR